LSRERIIQKRLFALGILVFVASGCAKHYISHPFKPDTSSAREINIIALAPVEVPSDLLKSAQVPLELGSMISEKLVQAGFQVVGPEVFKEKMTAVIREKGGAYDPITGKRDEAKFRELKKACLSNIQATTGAKAALWAKVVPVPAPFSGCRARWDGTTEYVSTTFLGIFCPTSSMFGNTSALSLVVTMEDIDGNILYFNGGGIQLLKRFVESFPFGGKFQNVADDQLLADTARKSAAVELALGPLLSPDK